LLHKWYIFSVTVLNAIWFVKIIDKALIIDMQDIISGFLGS